MTDDGAPWHTVAEHCDYCAHRWVEVMPDVEWQKLKTHGPHCPKCWLQNRKRDYTETDMRKGPVTTG